MISVSECQRRAGLCAHELVLGVTPTARHDHLLKSYVLNWKRGERFILRMMVADLRGFLDLGANDCAADVLLALRKYLQDRPQLAIDAPPAAERMLPARPSSAQGRYHNLRRARARALSSICVAQ